MGAGPRPDRLSDSFPPPALGAGVWTPSSTRLQSPPPDGLTQDLGISCGLRPAPSQGRCRPVPPATFTLMTPSFLPTQMWLPHPLLPSPTEASPPLPEPSSPLAALVTTPPLGQAPESVLRATWGRPQSHSRQRLPTSQVLAVMALAPQTPTRPRRDTVLPVCEEPPGGPLSPPWSFRTWVCP